MVLNEYYHVYNRGAHKAPVLCDDLDYQRFLYSMYLSNSEHPFVFQTLKNRDIFSIDRGQKIVDIVVYCLMPNHFHIAIKESRLNGITMFMRKLCTSYSMYYNRRYGHSGTLFQGKFKAKPVTDPDYLEVLTNYIHLNPFGLKEPGLMKDAHKDFIEKAVEYSKNYAYSSFRDYLGEIRPQRSIITWRSDL